MTYFADVQLQLLALRWVLLYGATLLHNGNLGLAIHFQFVAGGGFPKRNHQICMSAFHISFNVLVYAR
jgi:hypothetical protein